MTTCLSAYFLTLLIESTAALALGYRDRPLLFTLALVNTVTHPVLCALTLVNSHYNLFPGFTLVVALEVAVVFAEWRLLYSTQRGYRKSLFQLALWANVSSFSAGILLYGV